MPIKLDCLKECDAYCCRKSQNHKVVYDFTPDEVAMFQKRDITLVSLDGGYLMPSDCIFLEGNRCELHGLPSQPECCRENKAGGELCISIRRSVEGKRFNEVE